MNRPVHQGKMRQALSPGELIGGGHRIETVLGKGGFGITYKATTRSGGAVAIKEYFPDEAVERVGSELVVLPQRKADFEAGYRYFWDEAETLRKLPHHPNIVGVKHLFEKNRTIYIVMDFIDGVPLFQHLREGHKFDTIALTNLLGEITVALGHLHDAEVLHLDIKPQNIMIRRASGTPVLIDFGAARNFSQAHDQIEMMTEGYAPIEVIDPTLGSRGPWSDIYSLGVVGYMAATGIKPPSAVQRVAALRNKKPDPLVPCLRQSHPQVSDHLASVIDTCLSLVPGNRPLSAAELRGLLQGSLRRPAPTKRYGSPGQVSLAQITRSVKILHVIQLTPQRPSRSLAKGSEPIEQIRSQDALPPPPAPEKSTGTGDTISLFALSCIALSLIAVIVYVLVNPI